MKLPTQIPKAALLQVLMIVALACYATVRILNLSQAVQKVKSATDTPSYMRISREPIFGGQFLTEARPLLFPLVIKAFGGNEEKIAWAQGVFSIFSWSILALSVAYSFHLPFLQLIAFGWVLLLSLYRYVIGWDSVLLTESLSLSLLALFVAGWLWLIRGWQWGKVLFLLLVALLWTLSRDTNAWVVLMISAILLFLVGIRFIDKKYLVLSVFFLGIFYLSNLTAELGQRWVFPFQNVLAQRILPQPRAINYFANCGMPVSPRLMDLSGESALGEDRAFYQDPALADYRSWLYRSGKSCYMKWLLSDPLESIRGPAAQFETLITLQEISPVLFSKKFSPVLPGKFESLLYPRWQTGMTLAIASLFALLAVFTNAWKQNKVWWVAIVSILLVFPHYFIIWHGDVMGIYRHVLMVSIQFYLGLWLFVLLVLDWVLSPKTAQESSIHPLSARTVKQ